jgi:hypothetical protein
VLLDEKDSMAHAVLSFMQELCGDWESAIAEGRAAVSLNPNSVWSMVAMGHALGWGGYQKEGIEYLRRALRASPCSETVPSMNSDRPISTPRRFRRTAFPCPGYS